MLIYQSYVTVLTRCRARSFDLLRACCLLGCSTEIDISVAQSTAVSSVNDALNAAEKIGYPVILRSAFTLGGLGSGFANTPDELRDLSAKSLSLSPQVLIERSMKGWKELEYEVVRDAADVCPFSSLYPIVGLMHALEHYHLLQHGEF